MFFSRTRPDIISWLWFQCSMSRGVRTREVGAWDWRKASGWFARGVPLFRQRRPASVIRDGLRFWGLRSRQGPSRLIRLRIPAEACFWPSNPAQDRALKLAVRRSRTRPARPPTGHRGPLRDRGTGTGADNAIEAQIGKKIEEWMLIIADGR